MKELIGRLVDKAGIDESAAEKAIGVVKDFLEDKLPSPIAGQVSKVLGGMEEGAGEDIMGKAKDLFGK